MFYSYNGVDESTDDNPAEQEDNRMRGRRVVKTEGDKDRQYDQDGREQNIYRHRQRKGEKKEQNRIRVYSKGRTHNSTKNTLEARIRTYTDSVTCLPDSRGLSFSFTSSNICSVSVSQT